MNKAKKERLEAAGWKVARAIPQAQFMKLLGSRRIPLHYDVDDFENDLRTLQDLGRAKK